MNARTFYEASASDFKKLHELRKTRAMKAGLDVSKVPSFEEGGDYILAELMYAAGLPETKGKTEEALLRSGQEYSRASAICPD